MSTTGGKIVAALADIRIAGIVGRLGDYRYTVRKDVSGWRWRVERGDVLIGGGLGRTQVSATNAAEGLVRKLAEG